MCLGWRCGRVSEKRNTDEQNNRAGLRLATISVETDLDVLRVEREDLGVEAFRLGEVSPPTSPLGVGFEASFSRARSGASALNGVEAASSLFWNKRIRFRGAGEHRTKVDDFCGI